jgi:hypothetical protein
MHRRRIALLLVAAALTLGWARGVDAQYRPSGELVYAMHVTLAPAWFDPGETGGLITPFSGLVPIAPASGSSIVIAPCTCSG